jgi:hypothetical protein
VFVLFNFLRGSIRELVCSVFHHRFAGDGGVLLRLDGGYFISARGVDENYLLAAKRLALMATAKHPIILSIR